MGTIVNVKKRDPSR